MDTRATDVVGVLPRPSLVSVRAYALTLDPLVDPCMLARDHTRINGHEKSVTRA